MIFEMSHATYPQAQDPVHYCHWHLASAQICARQPTHCVGLEVTHDASFDWFSSTPVLFNVQLFQETKICSQSVSW